MPWLVIALGLTPAVWGALAVTSDFLRDTRFFGSDPIKALEHYYGKWILRFLVATLLVTPLRRITGWNWLQKYRRRLGLLAFTYAALHLVTYAALDVQLHWSTLVEDVAKRWYITIGMTAFLLMLALAVTSTAGWVRRLGKQWVRLHRAVYVIVVLGTVHFWMSVKADIREPLTYAVIFSALLGYRAWYSARSRSPRRDSRASPPASSASSA